MLKSKETIKKKERKRKEETKEKWNGGAFVTIRGGGDNGRIPLTYLHDLFRRQSTSTPCPTPFLIVSVATPLSTSALPLLARNYERSQLKRMSLNALAPTFDCARQSQDNASDNDRVTSGLVPPFLGNLLSRPTPCSWLDPTHDSTCITVLYWRDFWFLSVTVSDEFEAERKNVNNVLETICWILQI